MKMKRIVAPTMALAMERVKKELGSNAVIFQTKKVKKGRFFNLLKKENIEVLAAVDPDPLPRFPAIRPPEVPDRPFNRAASTQQTLERSLPFSKEPHRLVDQPPMIEALIKRLRDQGLSENHADAALKMLIKKWYQSDEQLTSAELRQVLKERLVHSLNPNRFQSEIIEKKFVMLVGSTGVGKTTTLAKLAGRAVIEEGKKAAFLTADTFRIAAIDQLRTYADILNVPIKVAYSAEDFRRQLAGFATCDRVFIDTAGRNFQDRKYVDELRQAIYPDEQIAVYLVLAATAKYEDMERMMKQFSDMPIERFIITKVDETQTIGAIISVLLNHPDIGVAYATNGQNVPDDLFAPDPRRLIERLLGDSGGDKGNE